MAADEFRDLTPKKLEDGPALHLDDLSEISRLDPGEDTRFYQDRARLRAVTGDLVASCADSNDEYEEYCRDALGLGSPLGLHPRSPRNRLRIAEACWEDGDVRQQLIRRLQHAELSYLHPHMGTLSAWELASPLQHETAVPRKVIAPPPGLTRWSNNKVAFAETVHRLFGSEFAPRTESAWNLAILAQRVRELAPLAEAIGLKLPDAAGGDGNVVLQTASLHGKSLAEIERVLRKSVAFLGWGGTSLPMTLMNRILGERMTQPFSVQVFHHIPGLDRVTFAELLDVFKPDLFDIRMRKGSLIFYSPGAAALSVGHLPD